MCFHAKDVPGSHRDKFLGILGNFLIKKAATGSRPGGSGGWFSTPVQATPRPRHEVKQSGKSRCLPPRLVSPTPSASAREVSRDTDNPAPTMKRPGGGGRGPRARHQNIDGAGNDLDGPAAYRLLLAVRSGSAIPRRAVPGWKQKACGIAVKLDGNRLVRRQRQPPEPAMVYARMIEMGAAEDAPKIVRAPGTDRGLGKRPGRAARRPGWPGGQTAGPGHNAAS